MRTLRMIIGFAFYFTSLFAQEKQAVNIIYIGNSITQGVQIDKPKHNAPPVKASLWLTQQSDLGVIRYSNQGVSGKTTVDFLPASQTYFLKVKAAADEFKDEEWAELIFSIMLGTNDSAIKGPNGAPISAQQYYTNMQVIIDELLRLYPQAKVVLHKPIWYSPNTYNNSMYLKAGLERLNSYFPQLEALVEAYSQTHPHQVFIGDTEAADFFAANYKEFLIPEDGNAGTFYLHPNEAGAVHLGEFWGKAIYRILKTPNR